METPTDNGPFTRFVTSWICWSHNRRHDLWSTFFNQGNWIAWFQKLTESVDRTERNRHKHLDSPWPMLAMHMIQISPSFILSEQTSNMSYFSWWTPQCKRAMAIIFAVFYFPHTISDEWCHRQTLYHADKEMRQPNNQE